MKEKVIMPPTRTPVDHLAYLISGLTSPFLILAALLLGATWHESTTLGEFVLWSLIAFVFFFAIPPAYIYNEVRAGRITDIHIQLREQRAKVFAVFLASAGIGTLLFWWLGVPSSLIGLAIVLVGSSLLAGLITLGWKISIHAWTVTAAITAFALLSQDPRWWWTLLVVPFVIWSRLHRDRHTIAQGIAGATMGVVVTWLLYTLIA